VQRIKSKPSLYPEPSATSFKEHPPRKATSPYVGE
jgi:hypothetical protein